MLAYAASSEVSDADAYNSTPTVEQWNEDMLGRPPRDADGKWIITSGDDFKTMIKGGSEAKVHHPIPERLIRYMNRNGYSIDIDKVAGVVLTREEHDLIEVGLKQVIPHRKEDIAGNPAKLLDDLAQFYVNHQNPKAKNMAKLVRGFKIKFL